jgi:hypothetical protein
MSLVAPLHLFLLYAFVLLHTEIYAAVTGVHSIYFLEIVPVKPLIHRFGAIIAGHFIAQLQYTFYSSFDRL